MSTASQSATKSTSKKAIAKKAPVAKAAPKNGGAKNGNGKDAILALRDVIVKTWPDVPTIEALQQSSGLPKSRVMMYRSSMSRRSDVSKDNVAGNPIKSGRTEKEGDIGTGCMLGSMGVEWALKGCCSFWS